MNATIQKIETILTSTYNNQNFLELVKEIFESVQVVNPDGFNKEFSNFTSHIEGSTHIANYVSPDSKKITIIAVRLKAHGYVENSRSTQRNYAKKMIENANSDAALVAFYTENDPKWRLSFVRLDYEMKIDKGRLKAMESLTPAKRYSFLVGVGEPCHTAIDRLHAFVDSHNYHPTLEEIEDVFSVEKVTDEFYQLYSEKFVNLRKCLDNSEDFIIEAKQHNFTSAQFAKKLMGQIVFLYFLQKKGWLGVSAWPKKLSEKEYKKAFFAKGAKSRELIPIVYRLMGDGAYGISRSGLESLNNSDEAILAACVNGEPWGAGPHNFMRKLYEEAEKKNTNFYNEYLEPLFYEALNVNRGEQGYCPALHCRIPFLSGGLFEPIDGYEWKHNNFDLPNTLFSDRINNNSRSGNGILDIFDRYNFTMSEDEPMEREVAIDPEMLGKVFENLLEDRKSKGAFYTPREIVHYMCQESLINYLANTVDLPAEDVRDFILYGDFMKDEDTTKLNREGNGGMFIAESIFKIEKDGSVSVNRMYDIDKALADVRVVDPAVGSGAFPLGMLNEILRARQNITEYLIVEQKMKAISLQQEAFISHKMHTDRSAYILKYHTVKNCLFAADIEPSAIDITQLRLWLSLVIDDEVDSTAINPLYGHRNPLPLPNLECNILCGNSLIDEFKGIQLINHSDLFGTNYSVKQLDYKTSIFDTTIKSLIAAQDELFRCDDPIKKEVCKEKIASLRDVIIKEQLSDCSTETLEEYEKTKNQSSKPYVLWALDFARVFREKGGFDIVIGNPPYIGERKHKDAFLAVQNSSYRKYYLGRMDYFYFFFHLALDLLRDNGLCSMITTNYFITALGGKLLRSDLKERASIIELINFNETKVFNSAAGQHNMISTFLKGKNECKIRSIVAQKDGVLSSNELSDLMRVSMHSKVTYLDQDDLWDGDENYIRVTGVRNLDNPVNSILEKMSSLSTDVLGNICKPLIGLESSLDEIYVLSANQIEVITNNNSKELEHVKMFFKGSAIHRYQVENVSDKYLLYLHEQISDIKESVGIWNYLCKHELEIRARKGANLRGAYRRGNWWVLNTPRLDMNFNDEKIVTHYRSKTLRFALSTSPWYASRDVYYIVKNKPNIELKYILALLNSSLYYQWFYNRGKRKGDVLELYAKPLKEVPIKEINLLMQQPFCKIVDKIMEFKLLSLPTNELERDIDFLVYDLYQLTEEEISLIESKGEYKYGKKN